MDKAEIKKLLMQSMVEKGEYDKLAKTIEGDEQRATSTKMIKLIEPISAFADMLTENTSGVLMEQLTERADQETAKAIEALTSAIEEAKTALQDELRAVLDESKAGLVNENLARYSEAEETLTSKMMELAIETVLAKADELLPGLKEGARLTEDEIEDVIEAAALSVESQVTEIIGDYVDEYGISVAQINGFTEAVRALLPADRQVNWSEIVGKPEISQGGTNVNLVRQLITEAIAAIPSGSSTFLDLTDTPATYTGQSGKTVVVNGTEDGLVFTTPAGGGDMLVATYDPANKAEQVHTIGDSTTTATASKLVERDASGNIYVNNYFANTASTVSAAGTTVLTVASARTQNLTGASNQTFQLPDATTLSLSSIFEFNNNSSGSLIVTNAGAATQYTVPAGGAVLCYCTSIGSANGTWDFHALAPLAATWSSGITGLVMNSALTTSPRVGSGASSATAPSFIPQRGANTTGFGGDGTDLHATIAGTAAMTIAATKTTVPGVLVTGLTASELTATDASKNIVSLPVATYPSLTETSYVKGVTSAIQTQINAKLTTADIDDTPVNGETAAPISSNWAFDHEADTSTHGVTTVAGISETQTFTNKRITPRTGTTASSGTPTINTDNVDFFTITALTVDITSMTTNLSGTPTEGQKLMIWITGTAARAITWGASFSNGPVALPTTTVTTTRLYTFFIYDGSVWRCMASGSTV